MFLKGGAVFWRGLEPCRGQVWVGRLEKLNDGGSCGVSGLLVSNGVKVEARDLQYAFGSHMYGIAQLLCDLGVPDGNSGREQ